MTDAVPSPWPLRRLGDIVDRENTGGTAGRVVVIDDHELLAASIVLTLRQSGVDARAVAFDTPDLAATVCGLKPDVVLLDLFLSETADTSLSAIAVFHAVGIQVVIVTATHDPVVQARSLELGAVGIIEKSEPIERLIEAVHQALRRESIMSTSRIIELRKSLDDSLRKQARRTPLASLTPKEQDVLRAIMLGHAAGRIARDHDVSVLTVRSHIRSVLSKLGVHSQLEAVSLAASEGWFHRN